MKTFKYIVIAAAVLLFGTGIGVCLWLAGSRVLSNNESVFLGVFVSLLSILASWLVSHIYAELSVAAARDDAMANLRTYALKAAEKVTNLSNELGKLAGYLQAELDDASYTTVESNLQGKDERMQSAIHLLQTLKSVNDGSLSDWEGVIGDELKNQRQQEEEREEVLEELVDKVNHLSNISSDGHDAWDAVSEVRRELRNVAATVGTRSLLSVGPKRASVKEAVELSCPKCAAALKYKQRAKASSYKSVTCLICNSEYVSTYDVRKKQFSVERRQATDTAIVCPYCLKNSNAAIDNMPGSSQLCPCINCALQIRISRSVDGAVRIAKQPNEERKAAIATPDDATLALSKSKLPRQPWPANTHRKIAEELGVSDVLVRSAVDTLIRRGDFMHQFNGRLFVEAKPDETAVGSESKRQEG